MICNETDMSLVWVITPAYLDCTHTKNTSVNYLRHEIN